jgi:GT2 family glycosyltransferase
MMLSEMNLFIVIAVYNRRDITLQCLSQLYKQSFKDFNIVVVDDGSTDGTAEAIIKKFPDVAIVKGPGSWWWTRSMNEGIKYAINHEATAVLTMNNDTFFNEDYIEKMKQLADENPGSLIGSLDITREEPYRIFFSGVERMVWWKAKYIKYHNNYDLYDPSMTGLHKSVCLNGRGTWVPAEVYHQIGLLDEDKLPQYASDFDFSLRADEAGIDTWISWDAILYSYVMETGTGKPFIKQGFGVFLRSFFSKYSQTSLTTLYAYYRKHCKWYYFPFAYMLQILKLFYSYYKRRNAFA